MTVIPLDGTDLALAYDRPNEAYYVLRAGVPLARFSTYRAANAFCWDLFEENCQGLVPGNGAALAGHMIDALQKPLPKRKRFFFFLASARDKRRQPPLLASA